MNVDSKYISFQSYYHWKYWFSILSAMKVETTWNYHCLLEQKVVNIIKKLWLHVLQRSKRWNQIFNVYFRHNMHYVHWMSHKFWHFAPQKTLVLEVQNGGNLIPAIKVVVCFFFVFFFNAVWNMTTIHFHINQHFYKIFSADGGKLIKISVSLNVSMSEILITLHCSLCALFHE